MQQFLGSSVTLVWLALAAMTLVSGWLGGGPPVGGMPPSYVGVFLILLAFVKVRLIMAHFMETPGLPRGQRASLELWVLGVAALLVAMQLAAVPGV